MKFESIVHAGRTYLRCGDCGRYGREGWPHDCKVSSSWFASVGDVERHNAVVSASKILDLLPTSPRAAVEESVGRLAEVLAVWPASMRTAGFVFETRELASRHLTSIGVDDGAELVEAAIMKAVTLQSLATAREEIVATRERAQEARDREALVGDARRAWLIKLAADMRRNFAGKDELLGALQAGNDRRCEPPLPEKDLVAICETIAKYDPTDVPRGRKIARDFQSTKRGAPASEDESEKRLNFQVEKIVATNTDPPIYWLTIAGPVGTATSEYAFTTEDLLTTAQFRKRFVKARRLMPLGMPKTPDEWEALVHAWLQRATTVELSDDASPMQFMLEQLEYGIVGLGHGQTVDDLDTGKMLRYKGRIVIKTPTALKIAREYDNRVPQQLVADLLRRLGFENQTIRFPDGVVRAWLGPETLSAPEPSQGDLQAEEPLPPAGGGGGNGHAAGAAPPALPYEDAPAPTESYIDDSEDLPL